MGGGLQGVWTILASDLFAWSLLLLFSFSALTAGTMAVVKHCLKATMNPLQRAQDQVKELQRKGRHCAIFARMRSTTFCGTTAATVGCVQTQQAGKINWKQCPTLLMPPASVEKS